MCEISKKHYFSGFWKEFFTPHDILNHITIANVLPFLKNSEECNSIYDADIIVYSVFSPNLELIKKLPAKKIQFTGEARYFINSFTFRTFGIDGYNYYQVYRKLMSKFEPLATVPFSQRKDCIIVSSNAAKHRVQVYEDLKKSLYFLKIDEYGSMFNKRLPGKYWSVEYLKILSQYKFVICIENEVRDWYHTEKIYNAFLANTIPIYSGAKTIDKVVNPKRFLNLVQDDLVNRVRILKMDEEEFIKTINKDIGEAYDFSKIEEI